MQHPDPDDLALLALGESLGSAVDAHVADCQACSREVDTLRTTVGLAELSNFGEDAPAPGEHVWQAIAAELGFADTGRSSVATLDQPGQTQATGGAAAADQVGPHPGPEPPTTTEAPQGAPSTRNGSAPPHLRSVPPTPAGPALTPDVASADRAAGADLPPDAPTSGGAAGGGTPPARWSRWVAPLAAAVVGIAIGAGAVVLAQSRSDNVTVEAIAPLKPVADGPLGADTGTLGEAELIAEGNRQQVRVSADQLPASPNAYEVWLFGDDGRMVSLGTLDDRDGSFTVPQGIDTREYRVVDVSDEAPDGNPAHSGISLIRGEFS